MRRALRRGCRGQPDRRAGVNGERECLRRELDKPAVDQLVDHLVDNLCLLLDEARALPVVREVSDHEGGVDRDRELTPFALAQSHHR
ncbi:hypothetical protein GCM10022199_25490 [Marihabitans asiaticum]|uniref:Uncharacterized protein n=1 Tax=Marihabitans asiaticum TaxID=415218 RepID=A0A560WGX0_9MICO|nr:hypothetical protein FB557_0271 [Marihabitans asiaticum]